MKKLVSLALVITTLLSLCLVSCEEKELPPVFTGANIAEDFTALEAAGNITPEAVQLKTMLETLTNENSEFIVGLNAEDFDANVAEGQLSIAMVNAQAHLVALFKTKEGVEASALATLLTEKFNPLRWVCVQPEKCFVITAQDHVLLVASNNTTADLYLNAFKTLAGEAASAANVFFTNNDMGEDLGGDL